MSLAQNILERESSSPKNALFFIVEVSDEAFTGSPEVPISDQAYTLSTDLNEPDVIQRETDGGRVGIETDQRFRVAQTLPAAFERDSDSTLYALVAIERESSSPPNALVQASYCDGQESLLDAVYADIQETVAGYSTQINPVHMASVLHAISDHQGNARADQRHRGGISG
jgi:hypothetical protein